MLIAGSYGKLGKAGVAMLAMLASGCGDAPTKDADALVVVVIDAGVVDARPRPDAPVFDADPSAPDAMPGLNFDVAYASEMETTAGNSGTGLYSSGYLRIINTGTEAFDLADLEFVGSTSSSPSGTQALLSCSPTPNSVVLQPGEAAGYVQSGAESLVNAVSGETAVSGHNICAVELKSFSGGGWGTFGASGSIRINGRTAEFSMSFIEKATGNIVTWTDARRESAN